MGAATSLIGIPLKVTVVGGMIAPLHIVEFTLVAVSIDELWGKVSAQRSTASPTTHCLSITMKVGRGEIPPNDTVVPSLKPWQMLLALSGQRDGDLPFSPSY